MNEKTKNLKTEFYNLRKFHQKGYVKYKITKKIKKE